jgi:hypothetical protein
MSSISMPILPMFLLLLTIVNNHFLVTHAMMIVHPTRWHQHHVYHHRSRILRSNPSSYSMKPSFHTSKRKAFCTIALHSIQQQKNDGNDNAQNMLEKEDEENDDGGSFFLEASRQAAQLRQLQLTTNVSSSSVMNTVINQDNVDDHDDRSDDTVASVGANLVEDDVAGNTDTDADADADTDTDTDTDEQQTVAEKKVSEDNNADDMMASVGINSIKGDMEGDGDADANANVVADNQPTDAEEIASEDNNADDMEEEEEEEEEENGSFFLEASRQAARERQLQLRSASESASSLLPIVTYHADDDDQDVNKDEEERKTMGDTETIITTTTGNEVVTMPALTAENEEEVEGGDDEIFQQPPPSQPLDTGLISIDERLSEISSSLGITTNEVVMTPLTTADEISEDDDDLIDEGDTSTIPKLRQPTMVEEDNNEDVQLSSDGKVIFEPTNLQEEDVNQENVDMGLLVLTRALLAVKSIVERNQ